MGDTLRFFFKCGKSRERKEAVTLAIASAFFVIRCTSVNVPRMHDKVEKVLLIQLAYHI